VNHLRTALKERVTFDFETSRFDVAMQAAAGAKNQHPAGGYVSDDRSLDFDLTRFDVAFDGSGRASNTAPASKKVRGSDSGG
jgi:hypothetical protein